MSDEELRPWTVRSSSIRVDEPFLRVRSDTVELPDGTVIEGYFVRESRGFVVVAALTPERRIVLVRQYKHGIAQIVLELPAGMIDAGETPHRARCASWPKRRATPADPPQLLRSLFADPSSSNASFHIFLDRKREAEIRPVARPDRSHRGRNGDDRRIRGRRARRSHRLRVTGGRSLHRAGPHPLSLELARK